MATSLNWFTAAELDQLIAQAESLPMRDAAPYSGSRQVRQDFQICFPAPRTGALESVCAMLEQASRALHLAPAANGMAVSPFEKPPVFDDLAVQSYPAGSAGIGIHRDSSRYRHLVVIITLAGKSRFSLVEDRAGGNPTIMDDSPGRLLLLSAPGFAGREAAGASPLHKVDRVTGGRLSIGLRCQETS